MVLQLSQALEARLAAAATRRGVSVEALAHEALERALDHDEWFIGEVESGLAQAETGEALDPRGGRGASVEEAGRVRLASLMPWRVRGALAIRPAAVRGGDDLLHGVHYPARSATMAVIHGRTAAVRVGGATPVRGQWRAMPDGIDGIHGIGGNVVSVTYRF